MKTAAATLGGASRPPAFRGAALPRASRAQVGYTARVLLSSRLFTAAGVVHGFTLRAAGDLKAPQDLERLALAAGVARISTARQVHLDRIALVAADGAHKEIFAATGAPPDDAADGLVAAEPGAAVGVYTADCVPVLLYDPESGAGAAVHSGWRGTRLSIAARGVRALQHATGADPAHLIAAVGPCIGRCCYEVGAELSQAFRAQFGAEVADEPGPRARLDLRLAVEKTLREAGVPADRIEQVPGCTSCDAASFFSYRREHGRTGRHLAWVAARA